MEQEIRFCTTSDGVRIAYATLGQGSPPLLLIPDWFSPFKNIAHEPRVASFFQELAARHQLILFDRRGTGMSDREVSDFTRGALVKDLEAVIDHLKLRRVALYASDLAGPIAVEYAFRHPNTVSHLILSGCYARGLDLGRQEAAQALIRLMRSGWDVAAEMWPALAMPGADQESARRYFTALRESCSGDSAADQLEAALAEDVTDLLPEIKIPALVLHPRHDRVVPFELGRELASLMPNARLVTLEWEAHWDPRDLTPVVEAVNEFLTPRKPTKRKPAKAAKVAPSGLVTILFTDMEGSTTLTQRLGDAGAQEVLRAHNRIIRDALKARDGSEIKHTGDGFLASFASASHALECAVAIQRAFAAHNESAQEPIRVRIGLNAGEPVAEDEDLFGTAVQLAARICAHAQPGQILASNVVRELAAGKKFFFSDRGDVTLRGFEDPVRLYEVSWRP
jgi:class 3 adenylate cyclase/alpha-beta hydrolase superfamily lysophospholipase